MSVCCAAIWAASACYTYFWNHCALPELSPPFYYPLTIAADPHTACKVFTRSSQLRSTCPLIPWMERFTSWWH